MMERQEGETWLESFSVHAYDPMLRLASRDDRQFLSSLRDRAEAKRYRRKQRVLLREYMRSLSRDFHRLQSIAGSRARRTPGDESGLSLSLVEQRMGFIFLLWGIELRLALSALLRRPVDLKPLLASVEAFAAQIREMKRPDFRYEVS